MLNALRYTNTSDTEGATSVIFLQLCKKITESFYLKNERSVKLAEVKEILSEEIQGFFSLNFGSIFLKEFTNESYRSYKINV